MHRDVKPSNILCHSANAIKVADFGIAQISSLNLTSTGKHGIIGTPHNMAPERFLGRPDDGRGDLYSAGVILFQLLTRERPFKANDTHELMNKVINDTPAQVARLALRTVSAQWRPSSRRHWPATRKIGSRRRGIPRGAARAVRADNGDTKPTLDLTLYATVHDGGRRDGRIAPWHQPYHGRQTRA